MPECLNWVVAFFIYLCNNMQKNLQKIQSELKGFYPETEIRNFGHLIVEKLTGYSRTEIILNKNTLFSDEQGLLIENIIERLKKFEPIQYILEETEFYGLRFRVNSSVLIPRPETEELVDWIARDNKDKTSLKILDIGTGSGCIAISLKHVFPTAEVTAFDISDEALAVAKKNAEINHLSVEFMKVDILNPEEINKHWDIIVSNPPYIPDAEKAEIQPNVLNYEPHLALFVPDNDPLLFYRSIAIFTKEHLNCGGELYFEMHRDTAKVGAALLLELGFKDVELRKDISGNDRMIKAILKD